MHFKIETSNIVEVNSDLLVIGFFKGQELPGGCFKKVDTVFDHQLSKLVKEEQVASKYKETQLVHTFGKIKANKLLFIGLGEEGEFSTDKAREIVGRVTREALKLKSKNVSYCVESFKGEDVLLDELVHVISEASILSAYSFDNYKTNKKEDTKLESVALVVAQADEDLENALQSGQAYGEGTCVARDLVNTPGNLLTPTILAQHAIDIAKRHDMAYSILDRAEMEELGMGALLAVAQGSEEPPKMIVIKYQGQKEWDNVLGFVGKGLTFDTGGISLKPAPNMDEMKMDMGGSAAVLGAMETIGRLKPECNIVAVIPSTENMPSGKALKPGDVITSMSGKTIEVKNTDAEGRLILADGITYAKQLGANYIVDLATLTGAVLIALGDCTTGAVTNNEDLMIEVLESAHETGELMWRLPSFDPYKELLKTSDVADLNNAPGRLAGSITAGLFLGEFAEDTPWVHLDIAGTAWTGKENDLTTKGGTGVMVRTLSALAHRHASK
jgi:leucyl aminopeptidase